jgi:hypothetical protein
MSELLKNIDFNLKKKKRIVSEKEMILCCGITDIFKILDGIVEKAK